MLSSLGEAGARTRVLSTRLLARMGLREESFLVVVAVLIGLVTAAAAVAFHVLINQIRDLLYERFGEHRLYGSWIIMLVVWPALGGVMVGAISRYVFRTREGHGIVDVLESVIRSSGFVKPKAAIEKIITSAITIGTGGSGGAEGPIVQIGAAIASGIGSLFRLSRTQMPVMVGCGAAAGISAIFNSPMGGLLFALEVILQDFSLRNVTPVVVASVIANVTTKSIFHIFGQHWNAILVVPQSTYGVDLSQVGNFVLLGVVCGIVGVTLTRFTYYSEERFRRLKVSPIARPGLGGALLGLLGIFYVIVFGHWLRHMPKPIPFQDYPMPAFFGDGYGFIQKLLQPDFYAHERISYLIALLAFLCAAKVIGTCLTLSSGGSGGIIAPSLFLGSVTGGLMGLLMKVIALFDPALVRPDEYALVGMAAVLAAVVHAPLASILILLELTGNPDLVLPAMLAAVTATGVARLIFRDSIYTLTLRQRGLLVGAADVNVLHRLTLEQVPLEPVSMLGLDTPMEKLLDITARTGITDFVVVDRAGNYAGMITADDIHAMLMDREAIPLLLAGEVVRPDVPVVTSNADLAEVLEVFAMHDVARLPVALIQAPGRVIGLVTRSALMRRYQQALTGK